MTKTQEQLFQKKLRLARNADTPSDVLLLLSNDINYDIRVAAYSNPATHFAIRKEVFFKK